MNPEKLKEKKVLITGGLGFIGSSVAVRLADAGATVTVLDSLHPLYGGNLFNIEGVKDKINFIKGDIRERELLEKLIPGQDFIFDFAAQVSPVDSGLMPLEDLDVNCRGHLLLLEVCREKNNDAKIFFSSSRMVYGAAEEPVITEKHATNPLSIYGIHKLTAEKYFLSYCRDHGIRAVVGRLTNPYGPRQQIKHSKYCIPGWFMRLAMENKPIKIFGDGAQIRDYIYIDDLVDGILALVSTPGTEGEIFNIGSGTPVKFKDMAEGVVAAVKTGSVEFVPWPENYKKIEGGDAPVSVAKLASATGWSAKVPLSEGIARMVDYYGRHKDKYLNS